MADSAMCIAFLGQAGYLMEIDRVRVAIDPYLSDSAGVGDARFQRLYPPPIAPEALEVDVYVVTHDHLDHLGPGTIAGYRYASTTTFVAPRFATAKLRSLAPEASIHVVDRGGLCKLPGVTAEEYSRWARRPTRWTPAGTS